MTIYVGAGDGVVADVGIEIEGLGVGEVGIGDGFGFFCPVGGHEAGLIGVVEARAEVDEAIFVVAFLAGEVQEAGIALAVGIPAAFAPGVGVKGILVYGAIGGGGAADGADPIGVVKDGIATEIGGDLAVAGEG